MVIGLLCIGFVYLPFYCSIQAEKIQQNAGEKMHPGRAMTSGRAPMPLRLDGMGSYDQGRRGSRVKLQRLDRIGQTGIRSAEGGDQAVRHLAGAGSDRELPVCFGAGLPDGQRLQDRDG